MCEVVGVFIKDCLCARWLSHLRNAAHWYLLRITIAVNDDDTAVLVGNIATLVINGAAVLKGNLCNSAGAVRNAVKFLLACVLILHRLVGNAFFNTVLNSSVFYQTHCGFLLLGAESVAVFIKEGLNGVFIVIFHCLYKSIAELAKLIALKSIIETLVGKVAVLLDLSQLCFVALNTQTSLSALLPHGLHLALPLRLGSLGWLLRLFRICWL